MRVYGKLLLYTVQPRINVPVYGTTRSRIWDILAPTIVALLRVTAPLPLLLTFALAASK